MTAGFTPPSLLSNPSPIVGLTQTGELSDFLESEKEVEGTARLPLAEDYLPMNIAERTIAELQMLLPRVSGRRRETIERIIRHLKASLADNAFMDVRMPLHG